MVENLTDSRKIIAIKKYRVFRDADNRMVVTKGEGARANWVKGKLDLG